MIEKNPYCENKDARQADNQIHCRIKRHAHKKKKKKKPENQIKNLNFQLWLSSIPWQHLWLAVIKTIVSLLNEGEEKGFFDREIHALLSLPFKVPSFWVREATRSGEHRKERWKQGSWLIKMGSNDGVF